MKCLVTGGAGFIGSHLVDRLLSDGNRVIVIDDFSVGKKSNLPSHYPDLLKVREISILAHIDPFFEGVDVVFHLAAKTRPQVSILSPIEHNKVNVGGTLNVLLAARDHGVQKLVFASSGSTYGKQATYPFRESFTPHPMSPYGLQKLAGEQYCELFSEIYNLNTTSLRFFNVYGVRQDPHSEYSCVVPKFIKIISEGGQPVIYGDGDQARDFTHVSDVVEAMMLAAKSMAPGQVFNIGSGENYSINQVFEMLCKNLGKFPDPIHGPAMIEPKATLADITKARLVLGWKPKVTFEEGLKELCLNPILVS